mmetsp:Transcript_10495/g.38639  ORF Transcript_10495/g.38639 Transcript_10495/m.38639 type:complete len:234 (-) Transcript_10495:68-769(-)
MPPGTRVIYGGVRCNGTQGRANWERMINDALENSANDDPLRLKLQKLKEKTNDPRIVIAFDDVSIPLPVMRKPDIRSVVMEVVEEMLIEEGITDITFVCSIALHRFIRPDEFRHCCGKKLFDKYYPHRMKNYNAVDAEGSVHLGYTRHQEDVEACKEVVESDLMIYVNINYAPMDGGYKSYGTGLVSYNSLKHNHDYKTLTETQSLMDPKESALHRSINRIGKMMQEKVIFSL